MFFSILSVDTSPQPRSRHSHTPAFDLEYSDSPMATKRLLNAKCINDRSRKAHVAMRPSCSKKVHGGVPARELHPIPLDLL